MKHFIDRLFDFATENPPAVIIAVMWVAIAAMYIFGGVK